MAFGNTFFDYKEKHPDHTVQFGLFVDVFASGIEADTADRSLVVTHGRVSGLARSWLMLAVG